MSYWQNGGQSVQVSCKLEFSELILELIETNPNMASLTRARRMSLAIQVENLEEHR